MQWKSNPDRYGAIAVMIHWVSALAISGMLMSGFLAAGANSGAAKIDLLRMHAVMGGCVLLLTLVRIAWWVLVDNKPQAVDPNSEWQMRMAVLVHRLFHIVVLIMVISGIRMVILWNLGPVLLDGGTAILPEITAKPPRIVHGIFARFLIALLSLHICAALYHHFIKHDGLLARMGIGRLQG